MDGLISMAEQTPEIGGLVETRVFGGKIPRSVIEDQDVRKPKRMLVLRHVTGIGQADLLPVTTYIFDAIGYGPTEREAKRVVLAFTQRARTLDRELHAGILIHHINTVGGLVPDVGPDLLWPVFAQGFSTLADVLEVA